MQKVLVVIAWRMDQRQLSVIWKSNWEARVAQARCAGFQNDSPLQEKGCFQGTWSVLAVLLAAYTWRRGQQGHATLRSCLSPHTGAVLHPKTGQEENCHRGRETEQGDVFPLGMAEPWLPVLYPKGNSQMVAVGPVVEPGGQLRPGGLDYK